jgi:hypothetical protein
VILQRNRKKNRENRSSYVTHLSYFKWHIYFISFNSMTFSIFNLWWPKKIRHRNWVHFSIYDGHKIFVTEIRFIFQSMTNTKFSSQKSGPVWAWMGYSLICDDFWFRHDNFVIDHMISSSRWGAKLFFSSRNLKPAVTPQAAPKHDARDGWRARLVSAVRLSRGDVGEESHRHKR